MVTNSHATSSAKRGDEIVPIRFRVQNLNQSAAEAIPFVKFNRNKSEVERRVGRQIHIKFEYDLFERLFIICIECQSRRDTSEPMERASACAFGRFLAVATDQSILFSATNVLSTNVTTRRMGGPFQDYYLPFPKIVLLNGDWFISVH